MGVLHPGKFFAAGIQSHEGLVQMSFRIFIFGDFWVQKLLIFQGSNLNFPWLRFSPAFLARVLLEVMDDEPLEVSGKDANVDSILGMIREVFWSGKWNEFDT